MADWTEEILEHSHPDCEILLGVPAYDDTGSGYHHPRVENLKNGLSGIHGGLKRFDSVPNQYGGVAIYCEWEMDDTEWLVWEKRFQATKKPADVNPQAP